MIYFSLNTCSQDQPHCEQILLGQQTTQQENTGLLMKAKNSLSHRVVKYNTHACFSQFKMATPYDNAEGALALQPRIFREITHKVKRIQIAR